MTAIDIRREFESLVETSRTYEARSIVSWGSVGSGKTSLAVNLSFELASLGHRTCLIDADTYHPSIAALLGLTDPGGALTAALRLARQNRLTQDEFERLSKRIDFAGGSLWLLAGLNSPARWAEIDPQSLTCLGEELGKRFDILVWDVATHMQSRLIDSVTGKERNQATVHLLATADLVTATFLADPVGVNRFLFDIRDLSREIWPVANRVRSSVLGRQASSQLRNILGRTANQQLRAEISEDEGFDLMLQSTRPLMLQGRSSKVQQSIKKLAREIIGQLER